MGNARLGKDFSMKRLGITVCTRQRPKMLEQCIRSICADINAALSDVVCFIVIVENDEFPRSKSIIDNVFHDHNKIEYHYECEPSLGIPIARNRAIGICLKNEADWLAFIDDDETLQCGWVDAMFQAATTLDADALTGPVHSILPSDPPVWLAPPSRDNRQHGELLVTAATNNTLIDCRWLAGNTALRFDEALRFTGGEDTAFFYRLTDLGGSLKWVGNASVVETVPTARLTMRWQLNRKARIQANNVRCLRERKGRTAATLKHLPVSVRHLFKALPYLIAAALYAPINRRRSLRICYLGLEYGARAIGVLRGLVGWQLQPYRQIEGN
jgi:succinoglycan biosynthesis protein ExoM